jgi:hypothetical protein
MPRGKVVPHSAHPVPQAHGLQESYARRHNDNDVQNHLNAFRHWNVSVDEIQRDPYNDQRQHDVQDWLYVRGYGNQSVDKPPGRCHDKSGPARNEAGTWICTFRSEFPAIGMPTRTGDTVHSPVLIVARIITIRRGWTLPQFLFWDARFAEVSKRFPLLR